MARKPTSKRPPKKADVKAAAARAEARSKGKPIEEPKVDIDPTIVMAEEIRSKMGRTPEYKPEFAARAKEACFRGATDSELAEMFGVHRRTIYRWKQDHLDFCHALIVGKELADDRVERSLYEKAVGYEIETEKIFCFQGIITRAQTIEHIQPDKGSIEMWLASRRTDKWRKVERHEHTGKDGGPIAHTDETDKMSLARWIAFHLTAQQPDGDEAIH